MLLEFTRYFLSSHVNLIRLFGLLYLVHISQRFIWVMAFTRDLFRLFGLLRLLDLERMYQESSIMVVLITVTRVAWVTTFRLFELFG